MCKYCEGNTKFIFKYGDNGVGLYINANEKLIYVGDIIEGIDISFCPMCGRDLRSVQVGKNTTNKEVYEEILDKWHEKVLTKADKLLDNLDNYEEGSKEWWKRKCYADGLYMATSILAGIKRKYK